MPKHLSAVPVEFQCQKCLHFLMISHPALENSRAEQVGDVDVDDGEQQKKTPHNTLQPDENP